jgi:CubicO group peptidase (beta-lactamase class C family)
VSYSGLVLASLNTVLADLPKSFPGAVVAITRSAEILNVEAFGSFAGPATRTIETDTIYDLASLTKVLATTPMAMMLHERGLFSLDQPLVSVLREFGGADPRRNAVTFRMMLAHSSGLPAHVRFFESCKDRAALLRAVFSTQLVAEPMSRTVYSDIGFILLGVALERLADEALDTFCAREIFAPLGMVDTRFNPKLETRQNIPPTLDDKYFRHRIIQGEVNDENAHVMGGVAGHAGLFAPASDVARFALCMLRGGAPIFKPETVKLFTARQSAPAGTSRTLGWDTPSSPSQSGRYFSPESFGHLGFTGTSLWIDPQREISITLLSNRTWPDAASQAIKQVRPGIHDAMMEALLHHAENDTYPQKD